MEYIKIVFGDRDELSARARDQLICLIAMLVQCTWIEAEEILSNSGGQYVFAWSGDYKERTRIAIQMMEYRTHLEFATNDEINKLTNIAPISTPGSGWTDHGIDIEMLESPATEDNTVEVLMTKAALRATNDYDHEAAAMILDLLLRLLSRASK